MEKTNRFSYDENERPDESQRENETLVTPFSMLTARFKQQNSKGTSKE